jgi:antitoxin MazE
MKTRVQKWGNSLAVRIPKSFADDLGLKNNSSVGMSLEEGTVVIRPDKVQTWDLDTLLAEVTDENVHPAWETEGTAAGATDGSGEDGR